MKLFILPFMNVLKSSSIFSLISLFGFLFTPNRAAAQSCDPNGNLIIFSNYDGGELNINVDVDIPDLRIGICSYEPVRITISGPFSSNVTEVLYAGFNSNQNNNNCNIGNFPTSVTGVPASNYTILTAPPVTVTNPNGNNIGIICAYSCDLNNDQGGCNTINQVLDYFTAQLGGSLYALNVQYCCWLNNTTYSVAALSGLCCQSPNNVVSIAYDEPSFCTNITTPQNVTLAGNGVGTYSAVPGGLALDPVTGAITPSGSMPGFYIVTYTVPGCPGTSATTTLQIINAPTATIAYQGPFSETVTTSQSVELTGPAGGSFTSTPAGLNLNAATGAINPSLSLPGTYTVTYTPPASPPCPGAPFSTEVIITSDPANNAAFSYTASSYCDSENPQLPVISGSAGGRFTATPAGLSLDEITGALNLKNSIPGTYDVIYTLSAPFTAADTFTVLVIAGPQVQVSTRDTVCGQSIAIAANGTGDFLWSTGETTGVIAVAPDISTQYCVTSTLNGCSDTACIQVMLDRSCCKIYVPNVFSPNSDGINDTFFPFATCPFESYEFLIFDRWGTLVFQSNNPQNQWNGTFNDKASSSDTYLYTISYQFVSQPVNRIFGSVNLLR
ncbi:MAG: gliding motility-associated C-terminal domain-containing protein [Saprospiraceae bacterium]|nr:gliding motility-associated C-terminal domain-containing protein [Saprospiraceae bacterium]